MNIKLGTTCKQLSSNGGLLIADEVVRGFSLKQRLGSCLPELKIAKANSYEKFKGLLNGFIVGADCLDDMNHVGKDPALGSLSDVFTARTYGNFLREFSSVNLFDMQKQLTDSSLAMRFEVMGKTDDFVLDLDSSLNRQYGKKMEGVSRNYKGFDSLDTLQAFDEFGFPLYLDVRDGSTFTSQGASNVIHHVFSRLDRYDDGRSKVHGIKRYFRGDSGFCSADIFESCFSNQARFVITFRQNMLDPLLDTIHNWKEANKAEDERIRFYDGRECEIGETVYCPKDSDRVVRVVVIRAEIKDFGGPFFKDHKGYDYYAWCTNMGAGECSGEDLIKFYRKRGHAENYIKELKYGFDLKHYPCQKLSANKAYGLIAAFAHGVMRYLSLTENKVKPHFAKRTRFKLIVIPCVVVRHARDIVFKFMERHAREVKRILEKIKHQQNSFTRNIGPMLTGRSLTTE